MADVEKAFAKLPKDVQRAARAAAAMEDVTLEDAYKATLLARNSERWKPGKLGSPEHWFFEIRFKLRNLKSERRLRDAKVVSLEEYRATQSEDSTNA